ncbi:MAG: hypothetical protein VR64_04820 [Desulfatitalea sp. BRH_c12]|nr:MAG: hypothetical protein VR64_04820 [Desulfatitalea sp. BRH_c12]
MRRLGFGDPPANKNEHGNEQNQEKKYGHDTTFNEGVTFWRTNPCVESCLHDRAAIEYIGIVIIAAAGRQFAAAS